MSALVRTATLADLPRVSVLAGRLVRQHHAYDRQRFLLVEPVEEGYARFFEEQLLAPRSRLVVAEAADSSIGGYAFGCLEDRDWNNLLDACGHFHDLYVDEPYRGKGLAKALAQSMLAWFAEHRAPRVVLMAAPQNLASQGLFSSLGFHCTLMEMTKELP